MPWPARLHNFSIQRVPADAESDPGPLHIDRIFGEIDNIAGGEVVHGVNTSTVGDAEYRYPNGRSSISDLTFDVHQASDAPESLGRAAVVLRIADTYYTEDGSVVTPLVQYTGFIQNVTRTRARATDSPRTVTFVPQIIARGGNANRQGIVPDQCEEYLDTRLQVYRTRAGGIGASVDHTEAFRTASGVSA